MLVAEKILVRNLGKAEYLPTVEAMRQFTASRTAGTSDEFWLLEHQIGRASCRERVYSSV